MFSKATLVKYLHICCPLAVDITHNRERKAPNPLIHWTAARLLLQQRKKGSLQHNERCITHLYFIWFFVHLFIHFYFGHLIFLSICYSHEQHLALFILKLEFLHQSFLLRCSQSSLRIYPFCESQPSTFHTYIVFLFSSNSSYFPHPLPNSVSFSV